ncbi:DotH/IcmK family type IV secretion protein [Microbulbifer epialgicus]|uniref:DotH/IcmK family type IV secretion protein n=1 Tax=Microbulbifer epialgicus TaxID=393907 RepID=A0ABV4NTX2_9GAMM
MKSILRSTIILFILGTNLCFSAEKQTDADDLHKLVSDKSSADHIPKEVISNRAFETLLEETFPTTAEQEKIWMEKERERINLLFDNKEPDTITDIISVSTKPGAKPQYIYVAPLHTSALNVIDSTGQPWPISAVISGNKTDFRVSKIEDHEYLNVVRIDTTKEVGTTNINFTLADLETTISVRVRSSIEKYHPSPILQIDREGPQAKPLPIFSVDNIDSDLLLKNIVLGVAPDNFEALETTDPDVEAWKFDGSVYVRTSYTPSAPLPRAVHHGPNGYSAYRLSDIPVLIMTSETGYEKKVILKGRNN